MTKKGLGFHSVSGVVVALALAVAVSGCAGGEDSPQGTEPGVEPNTPPGEDHEREEIAHTSADFGEDGQERSQLFDEDAVGEEPRAELRVVDAGSDVTSFDLELSDFAVNDFYLATVHTDPCGSGPEDAGPLYEGDQDTEEAPDDEADEGSVMLQAATDDEGRGSGQVQTDEALDGGQMRSLLIATDPTSGAEQPDPQEGDPVACLDLDLDT